MASTTLSTVIGYVLDDLFRSDLTAVATVALQSAIRHYERKQWWFQEQRANASTVASQEYYALPADFGSLDDLVIQVGDYSYPLKIRTHEQINLWQTNPGTYSSRPTDFALYDQQMRLWPIPDDSYTLTLSYRANNLADSTTAAASNAWTTTASELIRRRAEADVAFSTLQDEARASGFRVLEQDVYESLRCEHTRRVTTGNTRKRR